MRNSPRHAFKIRRSHLLFAAASAAAFPAFAEAQNWTGGGGANTNWSDTANWSGGAVPIGGGTVDIAPSTTSSFTVGFDETTNYLLGNLTVDRTNGVAADTLIMASNTLSTSTDYIGNSGLGAMSQTGGTHTVSGLNVGYNSTSTGAYTLGGGVLTATGYEAMGQNGSATFIQSGGTNTVNGFGLYLGSSGTGSYTLSGNGSLFVSASGYGEYVGQSGVGSFNQTGGSNTIADIYNTLQIAANVGSTGTYTLSGGSLNNEGGDSSGVSEYVGESGYGTFTQSGGTHTTGTNLDLGYNVGATGFYNLSGSGLLTCDDEEIVGYNGTGSFNQSGGTNTVAGGGLLEVGVKAGSIGTYTLSGTGALISNAFEYIGLDGTGIFDQTGGTNTAAGNSNIIVGSGAAGTYLLSGGSAIVTGNMEIGLLYTGVLTVTGTGILNVAELLTVYNTSGSVVNLSGGTIETAYLQINSGALLRGNQLGVLTVYDTATINGEMSLDGETSFSAASISIPSGGLLAINNASASAGSIAVSSGGEIQLDNSAASILYGPLSNSGFIFGGGQLNGALTNAASGQVVVGQGDQLTITGSGNTNAGLLSLGGGLLQFNQLLTNSSGGLIAGFGTLRANGGLTNNGTVAFAGSSSAFGSVTNGTLGYIHLSGSSPNVFYNTVTNNGTLTIDAGASGTFYGAYSGGGAINNYGNAYFNANSISGKITGNGNLNIGNQSLPTQLQIQPLSGTSQQSSLNLSPGSTLDLTTNAIAINFGSAANDPITTVVSELTNGYGTNPAPTWSGTSAAAGVITSSSAAGSHTVTLGYLDGNIDTGLPAITANQILVKYVLVGDSDLSGEVDFTDLAAVLKSFNQAGTDWAHGNFEYAANSPSVASTNFNDLADVLKNFLQTTPGGSSETIGGTIQPLTTSVQIQNTGTQLPEPTGLAFVACGAAAFLCRRRRPR